MEIRVQLLIISFFVRWDASRPKVEIDNRYRSRNSSICSINIIYYWNGWSLRAVFPVTILIPQNKEGILPVATLSIAIYVSSKARSRRDVARGVKCCRRRWQPQLIASTSKSHRASNALQQDKISILWHAKS